MKLNKVLTALLFLCIGHVAISKDVLLEFKVASFFPTDQCLKNIYGKAAALFGPEVTFQFADDCNLYGFGSLDFLVKSGYSVGLCDSTTLYMIPAAIGLKYLFPFSVGDFYVGLGFQPVNVVTTNCSEYVQQSTSQWAFGGIAKIGCFFDVARDFFVDLFLDYSFATIKGCNTCSDQVDPLKIKVSGVILGAGLGYRFG